MTQEQKDLLLKDLCARLPYGVIVNVRGFDYDYNDKLTQIYKGIGCSIQVTNNMPYNIEQVKPYLFPLSSMTEEQKKFFKNRPIFLDYENELVVKEDFFGNNQFTMLDDWMEVILWLIKNHFDIYGLIPMGLAIDATGLDIY